MKTSKFNKSQIFTKAWNLVKKSEMILSDALRLAWKWAKEPVKTVAMQIVKESEKAICAIYTKFGYNHVTEESYICNINIWIPKSLLINGECPVWFWDKKVAELY